MIRLDKIDPERVNDVISGKRTDRGCGLTTARLLQLFSRARPENDGKKYLFVGETRDQVRELYRQFYYWLDETKVYVNMDIARMKYDVTFPKPPTPPGIWAQIVAFFKKPYESPKIRFDFTSAGIVDTRARHYNKIILDVTSFTYNNNRKRITRALQAEYDG